MRKAFAKVKLIIVIFHNQKLRDKLWGFPYILRIGDLLRRNRFLFRHRLCLCNQPNRN